MGGVIAKIHCILLPNPLCDDTILVGIVRMVLDDHISGDEHCGMILLMFTRVRDKRSIMVPVEIYEM